MFHQRVESCFNCLVSALCKNILTFSMLQMGNGFCLHKIRQHVQFSNLNLVDMAYFGQLDLKILTLSQNIAFPLNSFCNFFILKFSVISSLR